MKIFAAAHQHNDAQLRYEAYFVTCQLTPLSHWHASHTALDFNDLIVLVSPLTGAAYFFC